MIKLGLIGYPLAHSLSPAMHKAALKVAGIEGDYALLGTPPERLKTMIDFMKKTDFKGFNVTIPHKVNVMGYLDSIDKLALKIGAVNTVVIEDNKRMVGHNTDVFGFMYAMPDDIRILLEGKKAVVVGSGGAARAVTAGLCEIGVNVIEIITLESEIGEAYEIHNLLNKNFRGVEVQCSILGTKADLSGASIVVNTTPVGMEGKLEGRSPISAYSIDTLPMNCLVYDIIYKPKRTKLIELADKKGLETLGGLDMLVLQGARAFQLWTGQEPPVDEMKAAIENL